MQLTQEGGPVAGCKHGNEIWSSIKSEIS